MKNFLKYLWLLINLLMLILPVFLPSYSSGTFDNSVINFCSAGMFLLSFPLSLFSPLLMETLRISFGFQTYSMGGAYLQLISFFVFGSIQWFWLIPKLRTKKVNIQRVFPKTRLQRVNIQAFDALGQTPFERVVNEKESESREIAGGFYE